jgi:hypothetical protein
MFIDDGRINLDVEQYFNWNNYLENYKFTIYYAENLVDEILGSADPDKPPIIILQSDHGARPTVDSHPYSVGLPDFPSDYNTNILNALLIPGIDISQLSQGMDPTNTFPIIFNELFKAGILLK